MVSARAVLDSFDAFWSVEISSSSKDVQSCTREISSSLLTWCNHHLRVRTYDTIPVMAAVSLKPRYSLTIKSRT
jgi:hypothetical protein